MYAVLAHRSGRIDVEELQALCERSAVSARLGLAPQYWVVAVRAFREDAWAVARKVRSEKAEGRRQK